MFLDRPTLRDKISRIVAFYQTNNTDYQTLSPSLTYSKYDRYVNEVSGIITIENVSESKKNFNIYPHQKWNGTVLAYDKFDYVQDQGVNYECLKNAPIGTLITNTEFWLPLNNTSEYLIQKRYQGADKAIDSIMNDKKERKRIKSIYENVLLYDRVANRKDLQANEGNFVGLRFILKSDRSLVTILNSISHQFSEAVNFDLYLYHSSQQAPISVFNISHSKPFSSQWTSLLEDNVLRYLSDDYDAGGEFFLGYAQSELGTSQAQNMHSLNWIDGPSCESCSSRTYEYYSNYSKYVDVVAFSIPEDSFDLGVSMFDPEDVTIHGNKNFGLNVNMTNECDLGPFVEQEESKLAEAINNSTGLEILRDLATNTRGSNNIANTVRQQAKDQIFSFPNAWGTVLDLTKKSLTGLSFDLSNLNDDCLTCEDPTLSDGSSEYRIVYLEE